jgi:hypothetical protein
VVAGGRGPWSPLLHASRSRLQRRLGHGVGIGRGSVDKKRVYAPTWAGPLSKLDQNVSINGLNSPDTYRPKYHICFIYFIFGYSLDTYPQHIGYVSDTYPSRIGEFGVESVFCSIEICTKFNKCHFSFSESPNASLVITHQIDFLLVVSKRYHSRCCICYVSVNHTRCPHI